MLRAFMNDPLVKEYASVLPEYERQRVACAHYVVGLLQNAGLKIHHVASRVKRPGSLEGKLRRKPGRYHRLDDVTDLIGVRVITYFESDVGVVGRLLEENLTVDWLNSVDKGMMQDPDRFGYRGVHYVVRLPASPDSPSPPWFEVQIRSILQHAWAEMEHDLGYKSRDAVPREVRRRFNRLSGLLEMADEEFMALHRLSRDYAANLPARVQEAPDSVFVDAQSMTHLLSTSPVRDIDAEVAEALHVKLLVGWPDLERPQRLAGLLQYVGVHSVGTLDKELRRNAQNIVRFASVLLPRLRSAWMPAGGARPGVSVVHYVLLRVCANPSLDPAEVMAMLDLNHPDGLPHLTEIVMDAYREIQESGPAALPVPGTPLSP